MKIIEKLLGSLDNQKNSGYSLRKLVALILMVCIIYIHVMYVDATMAIEVLLIDLGGVLILLGVVTIQNLIEFKNGGKNEPTN